MTLVSTAAKSSGTSAAEVLISDTTLAADGTFDVQSLAQTYNHLHMVLLVRGTRAATADFLQCRLNNDSGASQYDAELVANAVASGSAAATSARLSGIMPAASATAAVFGVYNIWIPNYANTTMNKNILCVNGAQITAGTAPNTETAFGWWKSTAAVNRVGFFGGTTANLLTGSRLWIYGVL